MGMTKQRANDGQVVPCRYQEAGVAVPQVVSAQAGNVRRLADRSPRLLDVGAVAALAAREDISASPSLLIVRASDGTEV